MKKITIAIDGFSEMQEMVQELKDILKSNKNGVEIFDEHPSDEYWE